MQPTRVEPASGGFDPPSATSSSTTHCRRLIASAVPTPLDPGIDFGNFARSALSSRKLRGWRYCVQERDDCKCHDPIMEIEQMVALLVAERSRFERSDPRLCKVRRTAAAVRPRSRLPPMPFRHRHPFARKPKLSAAGRKAIADAAKRRWAAIRAGKASSPVGKKTGKKAA